VSPGRCLRGSWYRRAPLCLAGARWRVPVGTQGTRLVWLPVARALPRLSAQRPTGPLTHGAGFWYRLDLYSLAKPGLLTPTRAEIRPGGARSQDSLLSTGLNVCSRALLQEHEAPFARLPSWQQVPAAPANSLINWDLSSRTGRSLFCFITHQTMPSGENGAAAGLR